MITTSQIKRLRRIFSNADLVDVDFSRWDELVRL